MPHGSLLDFYDKQQEQCNSVALLPVTANMVVRRHSSHHYPMLENEKQQQQQQCNPHIYQQKPSQQYHKNSQNVHLYQRNQSVLKHETITNSDSKSIASSNDIKNINRFMTTNTDMSSKYIDEKFEPFKPTLQVSSRFYNQFEMSPQPWHCNPQQQQASVLIGFCFFFFWNEILFLFKI